MKLLQFNKSVIVAKFINSETNSVQQLYRRQFREDKRIFTFGELFTFPDLFLAHVVCYVGEGSSINNIF